MDKSSQILKKVLKISIGLDLLIPYISLLKITYKRYIYYLKSHFFLIISYNKFILIDFFIQLKLNLKSNKEKINF